MVIVIKQFDEITHFPTPFSRFLMPEGFESFSEEEVKSTEDEWYFEAQAALPVLERLVLSEFVTPGIETVVYPNVKGKVKEGSYGVFDSGSEVVVGQQSFGVSRSYGSLHLVSSSVSNGYSSSVGFFSSNNYSNSIAYSASEVSNSDAYFVSVNFTNPLLQMVYFHDFARISDYVQSSSRTDYSFVPIVYAKGNVTYSGIVPIQNVPLVDNNDLEFNNLRIVDDLKFDSFEMPVYNVPVQPVVDDVYITKDLVRSQEINEVRDYVPVLNVSLNNNNLKNNVVQEVEPAVFPELDVKLDYVPSSRVETSYFVPVLEKQVTLESYTPKSVDFSAPNYVQFTKLPEAPTVVDVRLPEMRNDVYLPSLDVGSFDFKPSQDFTFEGPQPEFSNRTDEYVEKNEFVDFEYKYIDKVPETETKERKFERKPEKLEKLVEKKQERREFVYNLDFDSVNYFSLTEKVEQSFVQDYRRDNVQVTINFVESAINNFVSENKLNLSNKIKEISGNFTNLKNNISDFVERLDEGYENINSEVNENVQHMSDYVSEKIDVGGEKVKELYNKFKESLENVYKYVSDNVKGGYEFVSDKVKNGYKRISNKINNGYESLTNSIKNNYNQLKQNIKSGFDSVKNKINNLYINFFKKENTQGFGSTDNGENILQDKYEVESQSGDTQVLDSIPEPSVVEDELKEKTTSIDNKVDDFKVRYEIGNIANTRGYLEGGNNDSTQSLNGDDKESANCLLKLPLAEVFIELYNKGKISKKLTVHKHLISDYDTGYKIGQKIDISNKEKLNDVITRMMNNDNVVFNLLFQEIGNYVIRNFGQEEISNFERYIEGENVQFDDIKENQTSAKIGMAYFNSIMYERGYKNTRVNGLLVWKKDDKMDEDGAYSFDRNYSTTNEIFDIVKKMYNDKGTAGSEVIELLLNNQKRKDQTQSGANSPYEILLSKMTLSSRKIGELSIQKDEYGVFLDVQLGTTKTSGMDVVEGKLKGDAKRNGMTQQAFTERYNDKN